MTDLQVQELSPEPRKRGGGRVDSAIGVAVWVLLVGVVGFGVWFGWTVYQDRQASREANPAMRALAVLEKSAKAEPNSAPMRVRLAEAQAAAGLYDDAVKNLKIALKIDEKHTGALLDLGIIALIQGEESAAEGYFQKVIDLTAGGQYEGLDQRREQAYYYMGRLAVRQKRYEDGLRYLKGAKRIKDDASDTYIGLAEAYRGIGELDAAIDNAQIALSFDPSYPEGHFLLGELYLETKDEAKAAVEFRRAVELEPKVDFFAETLSGLGPIEKRLEAAGAAQAGGDLEGALEQATIAYALEPENLVALKLYAGLLEESGEKKAALKIYQEGLKLAPNDAALKAAEKRLSTATEGNRPE